MPYINAKLSFKLDEKQKFEYPQIKKLDQLLREKASKGSKIEGLFIQKNEDYYPGEIADGLYEMIKQTEKSPRFSNIDLIDSTKDINSTPKKMNLVNLISQRQR